MAPRYLTVFLASLLLPLGLITAVNLGVDAKGVYAGDRVAQRVDEYVDMLLGSSAGLVVSPHERHVKLTLARRAPGDCFVTGSSHEMEFGLASLPAARARCRGLINLAVSGGSLEDLITQLGVLAERPELRTLYVGVPPWLFRYGADIRWTLLARDYQASRRRLGLSAAAEDSALVERLTNLVNGRYFVRNLEQVRTGGWRERDAAPKVVVPGGANLADHEAVTGPDGSHHYSRSYLATLPLPPSAIGDGHYKVAQPYVDPTALRDLEQALSMFTRRGVHVVLVLSPYHPMVFGCANPRVCEAFTAVESASRALAGRLGGGVLGGYDARLFGLSGADFYDEMHMARAAIARLR